MDSRVWFGLGAAFAGFAAARMLARRARRISLEGKVVVVTGGSRGLGLVLARALVKRGARVAICARDAQELDRAAEELTVLGGTVFAAPCDVTDRADVGRFLWRVKDALGPVDALINNAGLIQVGPMELMAAEDFDAALRVHFWAPLFTTLAVLPQMRRRREGRIVNIASIGAKVALPHLLPYSVSKFALYGFSSGLRAELAKDGIRVTTVCPGLMRTGSAPHALMKGQQEAEYAWFKLSGSVPIVSMGAERAAEQILDALEHGDAEVVLSLPGRVLAQLYAWAPTVVQDLMAGAARLLPSWEGGTTVNARGREVESRRVPRFLTTLTDAASLRNNEL